MKKLLIIFVTFLSISSSAQEMQKHLVDTRDMIKSGKYQEALERCLWFHDHALEKDKSMAGVRLSFALKDSKTLADIYPPAMTALKETRDKKTKQIIDNGGTNNLFSDVTALNKTLGESTKSIELFEILVKSNPEIAKHDWYYIKEALFAAKRYDIIKNYIGNPVSEFSVEIENYNRNISLFKDQKIAKEQFKNFSENKFVEHSIQLIQYSIAFNDLKSATEIKQKAMEILPDYRLRDILTEKKQ